VRIENLLILLQLILALPCTITFGIPVGTDSGTLAPDLHPPQHAAAGDSNDSDAAATALEPPLLIDPTAEEAFPFPPTAGYLDVLPSLDTRVTSPPVVFMPPAVTSSNQETTAATAFHSLLYWHLNAVSQDRILFNVVPQFYTAYPYQREATGAKVTPQPRAQLINDARKLGAHYFLAATIDDSPTQIAISLYVHDLRSGTANEFKRTATAAEFQALVRASLEFAAQFMGLQNAADIQKITAGIPTHPTWRALSVAYKKPLPEIAVLGQADPDCLWLYKQIIARASDTKAAVDFYNKGLQRTGGDPRITYAKMQFLQGVKNYSAALLLHGQLLKRFPISLQMLRDYSGTLVFAYGSHTKAVELPQPYPTAAYLLDQAVRAYPENWALQWTCAKTMNDLAQYARGNETMDKIPEKQRQIASLMFRLSAAHIDQAVAIRQDCPLLWQRFIEYHFNAGDTDVAFQQKALALLHNLDPTNVSAELTVALSHSVGWDGNGERYLGLIQQAARNHWDDGKALVTIAGAIVTNMGRLVGFNVIPKGQFETQPSVDGKTLVTIASRAFQVGGRMNPCFSLWVYKYARAQGETELAGLVQLAEQLGYSEMLTAAAYVQAQSGSPEKAIQLADRAFKMQLEPDGREDAYWAIMVANSKLKNYDVAMDYAEKAIKEFPTGPQFYQGYAMNAMKAKKNLDKARAYLEQGVRLQPDSKVFSQLRTSFDEHLKNPENVTP
jgi:tetratricopeptide (TPR) repeat protein